MNYAKPEAMGLSWDDAVGAAKRYLSKSATGLSAASAVLDDPYFPEVTCQILRLRDINKGIKGTKPCPPTVTTAAALRKGVGLVSVRRPLRAVVYAKANPWAAPLAAAVVVGVPMLIGYALGKKGKR